jgi:hypothetical protein
VAPLPPPPPRRRGLMCLSSSLLLTEICPLLSSFPPSGAIRSYAWPYVPSPGVTGEAPDPKEGSFVHQSFAFLLRPALLGVAAAELF